MRVTVMMIMESLFTIQLIVLIAATNTRFTTTITTTTAVNAVKN